MVLLPACSSSVGPFMAPRAIPGMPPGNIWSRSSSCFVLTTNWRIVVKRAGPSQLTSDGRPCLSTGPRRMLLFTDSLQLTPPLIGGGAASAEAATTAAARNTAAMVAKPVRKLGLFAVAVGGQAGEAAEGARAVPAAAEAEALDLARVAEPELCRELRFVEQADLLRRGAPDRLGGLDLEPPVAPQARGRRDQLPDDHVLLEAQQPVGLALERRVGEHLGRLLEGGRRQEGVGRERGLGDAENDLLGLGLLVLGLLEAGVDLDHLVAVDELAGQVVGVALLVHPDLLHHLPHDDLDVLVVDVDALRLVDLLHLAHEVLLGLRAPLELVVAAVGQ